MSKGRWIKVWKEEQKEEWKDLYGKEREKFYNRNTYNRNIIGIGKWGITAIDNMVREKRDLVKELKIRE